MSAKPTFVTKPVLPPLSELLPLLEEIWANRILTNRGPIHNRFEAALADRLRAPHLTIVNNASIGLMLAVKQMVPNGGEVITTPFSFIATANAIVWSGATPVFADIEPDTLNLDPKQIERHITDQTRAILAVHCYGRPCRVQQIESIARAHGLKVIYDSAHAFAVESPDIEVSNCGDLSVYSFHATKVFNTMEGGVIVSRDAETKLALDQLSNHGIVDETTISAAGLNGKMSELNAAMGLLQLQHLDDAIAKRRVRTEQYLHALGDIPGIRCMSADAARYGSNYYAFPILIGPEYPLTIEALQEKLREVNVHTRRYFYPLISNTPIYSGYATADRQNLRVANEMAPRVLCLPLFPDLEEDVVALTSEIIRNESNRRSALARAAF